MRDQKVGLYLVCHIPEVGYKNGKITYLMSNLP